MNSFDVLAILSTQTPSQRKRYLAKVSRISGREAREVETQCQLLVNSDKEKLKESLALWGSSGK